jgi:hypothetical protein
MSNPDGLMFIHLGGEYRLHVEAPDEFQCADNWLYAILAGSMDLAAIVGDRIVQGVPPEGMDTPYIAFQYQAAEEDDRSYGTQAARLIYLIQAVEQIEINAPYPSVTTAVTIIANLLQGNGGATADGTIIKCIRLRPWRLEEMG